MVLGAIACTAVFGPTIPVPWTGPVACPGVWASAAGTITASDNATAAIGSERAIVRASGKADFKATRTMRLRNGLRYLRPQPIDT